MLQQQDTRTVGAPRHPRRLATLIGVCLTAIILPMGITFVGVALESISRDLRASFGQLQWVVNVYNLTFSSLLLTAGSLADLFGRRKVLVVGLIIHTIGALCSGLAWTPFTLDAFRAVQGIGAALMLGSAPAILANEFPEPRERAKIFGMLGASFGIGLVLGPLVGSVLTAWLSWRFAIMLVVPLGLGVLLLAVPRMTESRNPNGGRIDWTGLITFTSSLFFLILALIEGPERGWNNLVIVGSLLGAGALMILFLIAERVQRQPMFDLSLFRNRTYAGASIVAVANALTLVGAITFVPLYYQAVTGSSALGAGLIMLPMTLMLFISPYVTGQIAAKFSSRLLLGLGMLIAAVGLAVIASFTGNSGWAALFGGLALAGAGMGMVNGLNDNVAISSAPPERSGMANGMFMTLRVTGDSMTVAGTGAVLVSLISAKLPTLLAASLPETANRVPELAGAVASGRIAEAALTLPEAGRTLFRAVALESYAGAFATVQVGLAMISVISGLVAFALIRPRSLR